MKNYENWKVGNAPTHLNKNKFNKFCQKTFFDVPNSSNEWKLHKYKRATRKMLNWDKYVRKYNISLPLFFITLKHVPTVSVILLISSIQIFFELKTCRRGILLWKQMKNINNVQVHKIARKCEISFWIYFAI